VGTKRFWQWKRLGEEKNSIDTIMTPLNKVQEVDMNASVKEAVRKMVVNNIMKILVKNEDDEKYVVEMSDINPDDVNTDKQVKELVLRPALVVQSGTPISTVLPDLQKNPLAIVKSGVSPVGVVTLSDYLRYAYPQQEDNFRRLFWDRLCQIHRYRRTNRPALRDFAIDGITKTEGPTIDRERGYLGVAGTGQSEAERRLRRFESEGLVQINGPVYRLTPQGEQFCASRPLTEA
jgi:CBS domain-containing protein